MIPMKTILLSIAIFLFTGHSLPEVSPGSRADELKPGKIIDRYNGIPVYYNGNITNVFGRHLTVDGYNLGLKFQCVEYVKRYYYYKMDHKMNDSYGHAKDFFDDTLPDRKFNKKRGLYQFVNGSVYRPLPNDILIFDGSESNPFGHVAIVTFSKGDRLDVIQQNVGEQTRTQYKVYERDNRYYVADKLVLGWLRKG